MKTNTKTQQAQLFGILNNSYIFVEYVRTVVKSVTSKLNDNKKILNKKILNQESIGFKDLHNVYKSANVKLLKKVSEFLAEETYEPMYGARPVERGIQRLVEDIISEQLLEKDPLHGSEIKLKMLKNEIKLEIKDGSTKKLESK